MRNRYYMVGLVFLIFFVISLLTNVLGPIIPDIISSFSLSLTAAAFLPFSFFIAYGVMSIPAGLLIEAFSEKPVILIAFLFGLIGALTFALFPVYTVALPSLFLIGIGMAMLQVAINPLLRVAGGEEHFKPTDIFLPCSGAAGPQFQLKLRLAGPLEGGAGEAALGFGVLGLCCSNVSHARCHRSFQISRCQTNS
jgi:fucose permease